VGYADAIGDAVAVATAEDGVAYGQERVGVIHGDGDDDVAYLKEIYKLTTCENNKISRIKQELYPFACLDPWAIREVVASSSWAGNTHAVLPYAEAWVHIPSWDVDTFAVGLEEEEDENPLKLQVKTQRVSEESVHLYLN
jgi:hypothetical protein